MHTHTLKTAQTDRRTDWLPDR